MLTAGEILKEKRLQKNIDLETVEKKTKIRKKYIIALEENNLDILQGETYVRGFVKNYSEYLGLPTQDVLAILRRQYDEKQKKELLPKGLSKPINKNFLFSNKITIPLTFLLGIVILIFYVLYQFQFFGGRINLVLDSPQENAVTANSLITVKGKTDIGNKIILNGQEIGVDEKGFFSQELNLFEGENNISILAENKNGKEKKIERTVTVIKNK